jgi:hypothetical protein
MTVTTILNSIIVNVTCGIIGGFVSHVWQNRETHALNHVVWTNWKGLQGRHNDRVMSHREYIKETYPNDKQLTDDCHIIEHIIKTSSFLEPLKIT